jgi:hypothetical protein
MLILNFVCLSFVIVSLTLFMHCQKAAVRACRNAIEFNSIPSVRCDFCLPHSAISMSCWQFDKSAGLWPRIIFGQHEVTVMMAMHELSKRGWI